MLRQQEHGDNPALDPNARECHLCAHGKRFHVSRMTKPAKPLVCFGGPDLPARRLRNLLEEQVRAVPGGGSIDWVTYYFRDR